MPIRTVAIVAIPGVQPFELGVAWEGFGIDRRDDGVPAYDCFVVSEHESVPTAGGYSITTPHRLDKAAEADLVVVPAQLERHRHCEPVLDLLRATVDRGATVMSVCSGAFTLGAGGLLDGRNCTTHWRYAEELQALYPAAKVNPDVLFVCDGQVLTSAGTASGLDLCLHLIRADHGEEVARRVARRMVMPPHRDGGQAQWLERPLPEPDQGLAATCQWALQHLADPLTVADLARHAGWAPRTLTRQFAAQTGLAPMRWLAAARIREARRLLEATDLPVEVIAARCGLGTAANLRVHLARDAGTTPTAYRAAYQGTKPLR